MKATVEQFKKLPDSSGIYLFYNSKGELVYVGKATSLRSRVSSYLRLQKATRPIEAMMHEVKRVEYKITDSVLEAVILESRYIKRFWPKYNVLGKDNKSWNYIAVLKGDYPTVATLRQHEYENMSGVHKKSVLYLFGPFPGLNTRAAMKILRRIFHFSSCVPHPKDRPCLYFEIGECYGVCTGRVTPKEYKEKVIRPLVLFLKGQKKKLIRDLEKKMAVESNQENYESARKLRDQILALKKIQDITLITKDMVFHSARDNEALESKKINFAQRIEGYDISNLGESGKVGSMVVFNSGGPIKSEYKKFKIRSVVGQSDVDCLAEVLQRRFKHTEWPYPCMLLIDGGRPQVNRTEAILKSLHLFIPFVGIAKGPLRKKNEFVFPKFLFDTETRVAKDVQESRRAFIQFVHENQDLLIRVRDEAHRFAISYQRKTRKI